MPNDKDILKLKCKKYGLEETTLHLGSLSYRVIKPDKITVDSRKLLQQFEDVVLVIFVADLSSYDENLYECCPPDSPPTRLDCSREAFDTICNSRWLAEARTILVLHRLEAFREKIAVNPLRKYFPDYVGGADYASALAFLSTKFTSLKLSQNQVAIHHSMSREYDSSFVPFVLSQVHDKIISDNLAAKESKHTREGE